MTITLAAMEGLVTDAERDAARLLEGWWEDPSKSKPLPVDPFRLARRLGIQINERPLPSAESGKIEFLDPATAIITINSSDYRNRRRFTCAHEIGHYTRRSELGARSQLVDYRDTLAGLGTDPEEIYANQFAAALLMPAHLVSQWVKQGKTTDEMALLFGTSVQAMELRRRNLHL